MKDYLRINDQGMARLERVYAGYRLLHDDPDGCAPMVIINTPLIEPTWEERLADPMVMLKAELDAIRPHLEMEDDLAPTVRVQFGTGQVAAAFGCGMHFPQNSLPAAGKHVLASADEVARLAMPDLEAGWYGKLAAWTKIWKANLPEGVSIQHPDIQSAFNSAHLIRGNDIMMDFYDAPEMVDRLLDQVTDYMLMVTRHVKAMISDDPEWFYDWGAMWKGAARISNCSMQMISPELYREHVLPRDVRFFKEIGGGRMHYCGLAGEVIDDFFKVPSITGLDVDFQQHDFFALCERAPKQVVLMAKFNENDPVVGRLLAGDWPKKRNLVIVVRAQSVKDGKRLLQQLRR